MKKIWLILLAIAFGCGPKQQEPESAPTEIEDTVIADPHTSENALDYLGRYEGFANGKSLTLDLSEDFTYRLSSKDSKTASESQGTYKWNQKGNAIVLSQNDKPKMQFFVGENYLVMLDSSGTRLNNGRKGEFVLSKQADFHIADSESTPKQALLEITSVHWKLSEINGRAFMQKTDRDFYIELKKDGTFTAFAGCNKIGGKFEIRQSQIRFLDIMSTMMACPEMKIEDEFKKALEISDNYVANEKVLQLRKSGTNLLKFEAYAIPKP